jgi:hypothetical protein
VEGGRREAVGRRRKAKSGKRKAGGGREGGRWKAEGGRRKAIPCKGKGRKGRKKEGRAKGETRDRRKKEVPDEIEGQIVEVDPQNFPSVLVRSQYGNQLQGPFLELSVRGGGGS